MAAFAKPLLCAGRFFSTKFNLKNEMKEFLISAKVTISVYTKVEAETLEEAIEIANDRTPMAIIANGGDNEYDNWMVDEIDGEPFDLHEE